MPQTLQVCNCVITDLDLDLDSTDVQQDALGHTPMPFLSDRINERCD